MLGMDRRLIGPTLGALLVVLLWSLVMPGIDRAVDSLEVTPGTVYDMGPAYITPAPGWVLAIPPSPVGESKSATIISGGVTVQVNGGLWAGSAGELLDQVGRLQSEFTVESQIYQAHTATGLAGVARKITGPDYAGLIAGFVDAGGGITVIVEGPVDAASQLAQPVGEMIRSITFKSHETVP
jgi:hypothetical protein